MHADPPVLPCLQELNKSNLTREETTLIIDGWNCWFHKEVHRLKDLWEYYGKNKQSVGELWLGFLRYYTEIFDWDTYVVSIRSFNLMTRKSKNWTKHKMAIEDPFELTHNLAAGVTHKS